MTPATITTEAWHGDTKKEPRMVQPTDLNYIDAMAMEICRIAEDEWEEPYAPLYRGYAVLCLAKGERVTSRDVHDAWSAWAATAYPLGHRSLVPFDELTPEVQALDDPYRDAIAVVARKAKTAGWVVSE